jgi:type IV secretory pathway VirB10-like protein
MLMLTVLVLFWTAGCARPAGPQSDDAAVHADQHPVPFRDGESAASTSQDSRAAQEPGSNPSSNSGSSPGSNSGSNPASNLGSNSETGLPFHDPANLPAGTLLTVRLKTPISAENPGANGTFEAVVDAPVVIEGNRLVPRGATVAGRVESARVSKVKRNRGYVRLVLDSIHFDGVRLPIQTSSLFVRGSAGDAQVGETTQGEASAAVIRLEKGRRLTFRLTEPAYVAASQRTRVDR